MAHQDLKRTARHWGSDPWNSSEIVFWTQLASVQRRLAMKECGKPDGNWVDHILETYFTGRLPLQRCLSLGCGRGRVERQWADRRAFVACDAYDISPNSIAEAEVLATEAGYDGINYAVADINQIELPSQHYDAALAVSSAHHFSDLEHVFAQVASALKPDGLFVLHEYVGANRFQFGARQREVIEACLHLIPTEYRMLRASKRSNTADSPKQSQQRDIGWFFRRTLDKLREGTLLSTAGRYWRRHRAIAAGERPVKETALPTLRSVIAVDPSEAVRSAEILPVLETLFEIVEYRPLGGTILQFLLADIAGNFVDEAGEQLLEILFQLEDALMASGDLPSDFALIVARPRIGGSAMRGD
ncbi:MAG: class I SAM-dependent methyltransferase [Chloroflexota bacterium]|nr:class I SAM-dependent methyltransferase [Chloroflexota bacterium]